MSIRDLHNTINVEQALAVTSITSDTTTVSSDIVDTKNKIAREFVVHAGVITDGSYALLVEHGDVANGSDMATVAAKYMLNTPAAITATGDISSVGLANSGKRYLRLSIVSTGTTSGGSMGAVMVSTAESKQNANIA